PTPNLLKRPLSHPWRVIVHPEDEGSDRINVSPGESIEHGGILTGLVESLVHTGEVRRVNGFHADEDPLAPGSSNEVHEFLIAQQIGADLRHPIHLRACGDDVAQQRLRALDVDGEVIVDEKYGDLAAFAVSARFQSQQFIDNALVGAKPN